jgi:PAS domain S-box-containing protein/putative nucleotidyltransferase with HDIG domain
MPAGPDAFTMSEPQGSLGTLTIRRLSSIPLHSSVYAPLTQPEGSGKVLRRVRGNRPIPSHTASKRAPLAVSGGSLRRADPPDSTFLHALVQSAPIAMIAMDPQWHVCLWNRGAERLFGWRAAEVLGQHPPFVPRDRAAESDEIARQLKRGEAVVKLTTHRMRKDGTLLDIRLTVSSLRSGAGRLTGSIALMEDVTERRRLRRARAQRTAQLEALFGLGARLRAAHRPEEMYPMLLDHAIRAARADAGGLGLLAADRATLRYVAVQGTPYGAGHRFSVEKSMSGRVIASGTAYVAEDLARVPHAVREDLRTLFASAVIVPVRTEHDVIGTLGVYRRRTAAVQPFTDHEARLLQGLAEMGGTAIRRARLYHDLEESYLEMVLALARTLDARDTYTADHSGQMADWAEAVARALGCSDQDAKTIRWGALLHDIGKLGVPDEALRKPGPLTVEEWDLMRRHPAIGADILYSVERMQAVAQIVRSHQERWDGSGYPDGLAGGAIPLGARVIAVVDAYGAMIDDRPYRRARSHDEAIRELRRCAGTQFDPQIVEVFCGLNA